MESALGGAQAIPRRQVAVGIMGELTEEGSRTRRVPRKDQGATVTEFS